MLPVNLARIKNMQPEKNVNESDLHMCGVTFKCS